MVNETLVENEQAKLFQLYRDRVLELEAVNAELVGALDGALEVMEFAYMNAATQPKEIAKARAAIAKAKETAR